MLWFLLTDGITEALRDHETLQGCDYFLEAWASPLASGSKSGGDVTPVPAVGRH